MQRKEHMVCFIIYVRGLFCAEAFFPPTSSNHLVGEDVEVQRRHQPDERGARRLRQLIVLHCAEDEVEGELAPQLVRESRPVMALGLVALVEQLVQP